VGKRQRPFGLWKGPEKNFEAMIGMPTVSEKVKHDDLFQGILDTLRSWPDLDRQIFVQAHYHGQSIEAISRSLNLNMEETRLILQHRDHELHAALRKFRDSGCAKSSPALNEPTGPLTRRVVILGCSL
jgi:DNA-directed RNA polymerase specialized sigma24 family protein